MSFFFVLDIFERVCACTRLSIVFRDIREIQLIWPTTEMYKRQPKLRINSVENPSALQFSLFIIEAFIMSVQLKMIIFVATLVICQVSAQ